jgi:signal transduction histidine kinase
MVDTLQKDRLLRLLEVGQTLTAELDLETVLSRLLEVARELTGARYAAVGVLDDERRGLARFLTSGVDEQTRSAIGDLPRGRGLLGELIRDPKPLRTDDISHHPRSYGLPPGHPPMTTFLGVPLVIRGQAWGNIYLTDKPDGPFSIEDEKALGVLAHWARIAIENAGLYSGAARQRDELQRAVDGLQATNAIAAALAGETDVDRVLELVVKRARALVEARTLVILLPEGEELFVAATAGEAGPEIFDTRVTVEDTVPGEVLHSGRSERLGDVSSRVRLGLGQLADSARTALFVPLKFRGRTEGVLVALDHLGDRDDFTAAEEQLLESFAISAGAAVVTARSIESDRLRHSIEAAEHERQHWARELHDETLQGLASLQLTLTAALKRNKDGEQLAAAIEVARAAITDEIHKLQAIISDLRPAALDELGTEAAVEALVDTARISDGLEIECEVDLDYEQGRQPTRMIPELEATVYRLVQEALTNVRKHAAASRVRIELREHDGRVHVLVKDDGRGFDPEAPKGRASFGLVGMAERVALLNGELVLSSAPGHGTTVAAVFPAVRRPSEQAHTA